LELKYKTSD